MIPQVAEIVADVRARGDAAAARLGRAVRRRRPPARVASRAASSTSGRCAPCGRSPTRSRPWHAAQRPADIDGHADPGRRARAALAAARLGRDLRPARARLDARHDRRAGAGRRRRADRRRDAAARRRRVLAAARELGIDEVYAVGGAQAIAALAYGTETIPPVDKIVGPGNRCVNEAKLLVSRRRRDRPARRAERGGRDRRRERRRRRTCAADLLAQAEHGPDGEAILVTTSSRARRRGRSRGRTAGRRSRPSRRSRRRSRARTSSRPSTSSCSSRTRRRSRPAVRNAGAVFVGTSAVLGDYATGANHVLPTGGLARGAGGLGLEAFLQAGAVRPRDAARASPPSARRSRPSPALEGLPAHAAAVAVRSDERQPAAGRLRAVRLGLDGRGGRRAPRAPPRRGHPLRRERPAAARRAAGPARRELRAPERVPARRRTASCARRPPATPASSPEQIVLGAGADDLIAPRRAHVPRARAARLRRSAPTYPLYAIASGVAGAELTDDPADARPDLVCNPNNPTGELVEPGAIAALAALAAGRRRRRRRGVLRVRRRDGRAADRGDAEPDRDPDVLEGVRPRGAARRLRGRLAGGRRASSTGAATRPDRRARRADRRRRAARAAARRRADGRRARAAARGAARRRPRLPPVHGELRLRPGRRRPRRRARGAGARRAPLPGRDPDHRPAAGRERPPPRRARAPTPAPAAARSALVLRTTAETALRVSLALDGQGRARVATGVGFFDHLLDAARASTAGSTSRCSPAATSTSTSTTRSRTSWRRSATRSADALGDRARRRALRLGDRADGRGARDRGRRPRPPPARGGRARLRAATASAACALTLLPHALERFAMQAGLTLHVEAAGADDHHVAEAAFKAVGRALREACARDGGRRPARRRASL